MAVTSLALKVAIALLMVDSIIELSFISDMVSWLHNRAGKAFEIAYNGSEFSLHGKPANLLLDQGHTSNGAAGTAFVGIGLIGIIALFWQSRSHSSRLSKYLYNFWLVLTVLSALLSLAALIYTFVLTYDHNGQKINVALASTLHNHPYPNYVAYPLLEWTPENWFRAILNQLDVVSSADRSTIRLHLRLMVGWRWNLIPMFIIGVAVSVLAWMDAVKKRRGEGKAYSQEYYAKG